MVANPGRVTLVFSMVATIHFIFKSKHTGTHTLRLLAQQLPPQLEVCVRVCLRACSREICVLNSKSPFEESMCVCVLFTYRCGPPLVMPGSPGLNLLSIFQFMFIFHLHTQELKLIPYQRWQLQLQ